MRLPRRRRQASQEALFFDLVPRNQGTAVALELHNRHDFFRQPGDVLELEPDLVDGFLERHTLHEVARAHGDVELPFGFGELAAQPFFHLT
jgi:hypothetical protein